MIVHNYILTNLIQYSLGLDEELDRVMQRAYHYEDFGKFCVELKKSNKYLRQIFIDELTFFEANNRYQQYEQLNEAIEIWNQLKNLVALIEEVCMENYLKEIMLPFIDFINRTGLNCEIFTLDRTGMNFSFCEFWLGLSKRLVNLGYYGATTKRRVIYTFPKFQNDNALLGTVMAHEFGHYLDITECEASENLYITLFKESEFAPLYKYIIFPQGNLNSDDSISKTILTSILDIMYMSRINPVLNWIRELFADIVATLFYGPAYFFALSSLFFDSTKLNTNTSIGYEDFFGLTHPPHTLRYKTIISVLSRLGIEDVKIEPKLYEKIEALKKTLNVGLNDITKCDSRKVYFANTSVYLKIDKNFYELLADILIRNLDKIINHASKCVPYQFQFTDKLWEMSMDSCLQTKIVNLIPPNEIKNNEPVPLSVIINAGWVSYYLQFDEIIDRYFRSLDKTDRNFKVFSVLNSLVKKALESSYIHRRWKEEVVNL